MSPFDIVKSVVSSKEDLFTTEEVFNKEYIPFMVNRILSNEPTTALFANVMNQYADVPKLAQYTFYRLGIPKQRMSKMWTKKEESFIPEDHIDHVCKMLGVSKKRAQELYPIIGSSVVQDSIDSHGGRM